MSSFILKILAIIFMTIDHIGFVLFPKISILRKIGRLAFPIFAFQVSVGFKHTKSKEKYILRMILFTIVSQLPFYLVLKFAAPNSGTILNIGATLTFGLLTLYCIDKFDKIWQKILSALFVILIGSFIPMDYGWYGILTIVIFYLFGKNKLLMSIAYTIILIMYCNAKNSIFNLPAILALIPISLYNGKKGKNIKYLFYAFYPVHLLIIYFIAKFNIL